MPEPTDEQLEKARRAQAVLTEAGWAFDEFVSAAKQEWLDTAPEAREHREILYFQAQAASKLQQALTVLVERTTTEKQIADAKRERAAAKPDTSSA